MGQIILEWPIDLVLVGRGSRVTAQLSAGHGPIRKVARYGGLHADDSHGILGSFDRWRLKLSLFWQPVAGGWASALLLGERRLISPEIMTHYRDTGLAHLLAISGLHVG